MTIYYLQDYKPSWSIASIPQDVLRDVRTYRLSGVPKTFGLMWCLAGTQLIELYPNHTILRYGVVARRQLSSTDWEVDVEIIYTPKSREIHTKK